MKYKVLQLQENKFAVAEHGVVVALFNERTEAYAYLNKVR